MKFICDKCSSKYSIADDKIQKKVLKIKCKKCSHVIIVRDPQARTQSSADTHSAHSGPEHASQQGLATHRPVDPSTRPFAAQHTHNTHNTHNTQAEPRSSYAGHSTLHAAHQGDLKLDMNDMVRQEERTVIARISTEWIRQVREEKHEEPVWFMALHGQPHGPVVLSEVLHHIQTGNIQNDTLVWRGGWPEWISAGTTSELREYFGRPVPAPVTPPPITYIQPQPAIHEPQRSQPQPSQKSPQVAHVSGSHLPKQPASSGISQASPSAQGQSRQAPTPATSGASFLESVVSPTGFQTDKSYHAPEVVHATTIPSQPAITAHPSAYSPQSPQEKSFPRSNGSGNFSQAQGFGHVTTRPSPAVPQPGRSGSFPSNRPENPARSPMSPLSPGTRQQDIAHEKRAVPAVEFIESNAEADFFARPSSEIMASVSSNSSEMLEVALPPIPLMDIPPEELSIDDADIIEIRETIKPKWSARLAVAAGLGVIAVLLTLPLLLNSGQSKIKIQNTPLPEPQPWSKEPPKIRLSQKELEARMRLLERDTPPSNKNTKPSNTRGSAKKAQNTKRRYRAQKAAIRIQTGSQAKPKILSIDEKIRQAYLAKTNQGTSTKKKVEASGNIDVNLQKRLYKELSAQNTRVQYCYNLHLKRDYLEGTITLTLQISPSGRVTNVQVNRFRGLEFTKCLIREIRYKWQFSSFSGTEPVYLESKYDLRASQ